MTLTPRRARMGRDYVFRRSELPLGVVIIDDQGEYDFHRHEGYIELVVVAEGRALHLVDGQRYPVSAGDVFVILGEREHAYCRVENLTLVNVLADFEQIPVPLHDLTACPGYQVLFHIDPGSALPDRFENRFRLDYAQLTEARTLAERLAAILRAGREGVRFHAVTAFQALMGYLVECYGDNPAGVHLQSAPHRMGALTGFMESHFAEPLTVEEMCARTHLSRSNLFRLFKLYLKQTPLEYLQTIRLERARELLATTDLGVTEIAFLCGFRDGNYFSRRFHQACGMSPRHFRRRLQADGGQ